MDQSTYDVRLANWFNIITECQQYCLLSVRLEHDYENFMEQVRLVSKFKWTLKKLTNRRASDLTLTKKRQKIEEILIFIWHIMMTIISLSAYKAR